MALPIVAIVGRPNVGKSTLINRISQTADAIVHEMRGVTRDRSYHEADWNGAHFMLIDTGGIAIGDADRFQESITAQALSACDEADAIIFLVDGRTGMTEEDQRIAGVLKRTKTPIFLAVNKLDNPGDESPLWEFYGLGLGDPYPVSAVHGHGTGDMLDDVVAALPADFDEPEEDDAINVAIIGRPNAGKSSLTNRLVGKERSIVADHAGTTRDAIDTVVEHEGTRYRIVDTAGIRKKSAIDEDVEYYGFVRSLRAIDRADVALLMIDATLGLTDQDQRVAGLAKERGCAMVIVVNKWDLVEDPARRDEIKDFIEDRMGFVSYAPVLTISALTGRSVHRVWDAIDSVYEGYSTHIPTNKLNHFLTELRDFGHTVSKGPKRLKLNYVTQTDVQPPAFTFFCNAPELVDDNFRRYLENRMRTTFPLAGTPIRMHFKHKN
ncbi:MAG: ribosome biogenesis GTPase Der [Coriobacteriaceae bacterium]|nr:ribosome biogenesis GTPase Der [Coriobacteriaceae bacterium]MDD6769152.1 ribosome biogenesis GTPase Der [Coriobacteriaceae bacterium]